MLKFYYHPLSPIARRVWLALLEKGLAFEPILVNLRERENFTPAFLALNPFHHVPVLVDGDRRLLESYAILDYLDAKHPESSLTPKDAAALAQMRMVQMVIANEFMPKLPVIATAPTAAAPEPATLKHIDTVLSFLGEQLGRSPFFGGDQISLADIAVGSALPLAMRLGLDLEPYPVLGAWCDRVTARPAWQQTDPSAADLKIWQRWISLMIKRHQRR